MHACGVASCPTPYSKRPSLRNQLTEIRRHFWPPISPPNYEIRQAAKRPLDFIARRRRIFSTKFHSVSDFFMKFHSDFIEILLKYKIPQRCDALLLRCMGVTSYSVASSMYMALYTTALAGDIGCGGHHGPTSG